MHPVGSGENFMLAVGPTYAIGAYVLDGACGLDRLGAELSVAMDQAPNMRAGIRRIGPWHFWFDRPKPAVEDRLLVVEDEGLTGPRGLARVVEKVRLLEPPGTSADWLTVVVNPAGTPGSAKGSLVILYFNHAIADAMRMQQLVAGLDRDAGPEAKHLVSGAPGLRRLSSQQFFALPENRVPPARMAMLPMETRRIRAAAAGIPIREWILQSAAILLRDKDFYPAQNGADKQAVCTYFTRQHSDRKALGNFVSGARYRIPGRVDGEPAGKRPAPILVSDGRNSGRQQSIASIFPHKALKRRVSEWYARFDMLLSLVPMGKTGTRLGGCPVKGVYGVMPLLADIPLTMAAMSHDTHINFTLIPGQCFTGAPSQLAERFADLLTRPH